MKRERIATADKTDAAYQLSNLERETVILFNLAEKTATVFTWDPKLQRQLESNPEAVLKKQGIHKVPRDRWMQFHLPKNLVRIRTRRVLSAEAKQAAAERMRAAMSKGAA